VEEHAGGVDHPPGAAGEHPAGQLGCQGGDIDRITSLDPMARFVDRAAGDLDGESSREGGGQRSRQPVDGREISQRHAGQPTQPSIVITVPAVEPTPASTVLVLRHRLDWEVLMVKRPARGVFGGIWVFPGGALEPIDHDAAALGFDDPWRAAAMRETAEEVGVYLTDPQLGHLARDGRSVLEVVTSHRARFAPERLRHISTFVTPEGVPRRFDTRFYLAEVPGDTDASVDEAELVDVAWITPAAAIARHTAGSWSVILPTLHHLRLLAESDDPPALQPAPPRAVRLHRGRPAFVEDDTA
jgi:8-oxo-dGTP pyrophosphatase MutT (NUDIX family)